MKKILLALLLMPLIAGATTVNGVLRDINIRLLTTRVRFVPINNVVAFPGYVEVGPAEMILATNGMFSVELDNGTYEVSFPTVPQRNPFQICVPAAGTFNLIDVICNPAVPYAFTNTFFGVRINAQDMCPDFLDSKIQVQGLLKVVSTNNGCVTITLIDTNSGSGTATATNIFIVAGNGIGVDTNAPGVFTINNNSTNGFPFINTNQFASNSGTLRAVSGFAVTNMVSTNGVHKGATTFLPSTNEVGVGGGAPIYMQHAGPGGFDIDIYQSAPHLRQFAPNGTGGFAWFGSDLFTNMANLGGFDRRFRVNALGTGRFSNITGLQTEDDPFGVWINSYIPNMGGSVAAATGHPAYGQEIWDKMPTPPVYWTTFFLQQSGADEAAVSNQVRNLIATGIPPFLALFNQRFVIEIEGWQQTTRDAGGGLTWNTTQFPRGMPWLVNFCHTNGFGVCLQQYYGRPGQEDPYAKAITDQDHVQWDVQRMLSWNVDTIRVGSVAGGTGYELEMARKWDDAVIHPGGRPIGTTNMIPGEFGEYFTYSNNIGIEFDSVGPPFTPDLAYAFNCQVPASRPSADTGQSGVVGGLAMTYARFTYTNFLRLLGRGHYFSAVIPDDTAINAEDYRFFYTMAANFPGFTQWGFYTNEPSWVISEFTNTAMMAIYFDTLQIPAVRFRDDGPGSFSQWVKPLEGGDYAVTFVNETGSAADIGVLWPQLRSPLGYQNPVGSLLGSFRLDTNAVCSIYDVWNKTLLGNYRGSFSANVPAHSLRVYRFTPLPQGVLTEGPGIRISGNVVMQTNAYYDVINKTIIQTNEYRVAGTNGGLTMENRNNAGIITGFYANTNAAGSSKTLFYSSQATLYDHIPISFDPFDGSIIDSTTITATNGFSSDLTKYTRMPTNTPSDGYVMTAAGTAGFTKWAVAGGSGGISAYTDTLFVRTNGNNATAVKGDPGKPWLSISNAVAASSVGDVIDVGSGVFDTGHGLNLKAGTTLQGGGWDTVLSNSVTTVAADGCIVNLASGCLVKNLWIWGTDDAQLQPPIGIYSDATIPGAAFTNAVLINVRTRADSDGFYCYHTNACSLFGYGCLFEGKWDTFADGGNTNSHFEFWNSAFRSRGPSLSGPQSIARVANLYEGEVKFVNCELSASNAPTTTCGIGVFHTGAIVDLIDSYIFTGSTNGTILDIDNATNGTVRVRGIGVNNSKTSGTISYPPAVFQPYSSTDNGLIVKGVTSQLSDLVQFQDVNGNVKSSFYAGGGMDTKGHVVIENNSATTVALTVSNAGGPIFEGFIDPVTKKFTVDGVGNLGVGGTADITNTLTARGSAAVSGQLQVTNAVTARSTLAVSGATTLTNTLQVEGNQTNTGKMEVTGGVTNYAGFKVGGDSYLVGNVVSDGNMTAAGTVTFGAGSARVEAQGVSGNTYASLRNLSTDFVKLDSWNGSAIRSCIWSNGLWHVLGNSLIDTNLIAGGTVIATNGFTSYTNSLAVNSFTFPATTVNWTNPVHVAIEVYIDNSGVTGTAIKKNGTQIFSSLVGDVTIGLRDGEYFSCTYSVGTPVGTWSVYP